MQFPCRKYLGCGSGFFLTVGSGFFFFFAGEGKSDPVCSLRLDPGQLYQDLQPWKISLCKWRKQLVSADVVNVKKILKRFKLPVSVHTCPVCSELPSNISTMTVLPFARFDGSELTLVILSMKILIYIYNSNVLPKSEL